MDLLDIKPADVKAASADKREASKDARAESKVRAKPTPAEKNVTATAMLAAAMGAEVAGGTNGEATAIAIGKAAAQAPNTVDTNSLINMLPGNAEVVDVAAGLAQTEATAEKQEAFKDSVGFTDQVGAAFMEMTALPVLFRTLERPTAKADPTFDYMAIRDKVENGLPESERQFLRESVSEEDLKVRVAESAERMERYKKLGAHGQGMAIAAGLTGGLMDPVGWAATLGVGKVMQLGGIGARAAAVSGSYARTAAYGAAEGVVGNVLTEAALDAAGAHVTAQDYLVAGSLGAIFGQANLLGVKNKQVDSVAAPEIEARFGDIQKEAQTQNAELYAQAQGRAGPEATPEMIQAEVDRITLEQADFVTRAAHADVEDHNMVLPKMDEPINEDGSLKNFDEVLMDPITRADTEARWGIDELTVEDKATRTMMGEIAARAEAWDAANPMDASRLDTILAKAPWLASTGINLARSNNPIARMLAGTLLESTTGAAGRRRTAAIDKTMKERVYMEDLRGYEAAYQQYRNRTGGSAFRDILGSDHRRSFDRAVAMEREQRRLGGATTADPTIKHAADVLDNGYNRMRLDQQRAGTVGSARLGDTSVGYVHRAISGAWISRASHSEIRALSTKLADQLEASWGDRAFAQKIATQYIERARTGAYGGTSVPANLASPEAAGALRDTLRAAGVADKDIEKAMGRFSRGGASHTKKRLDLDLSETIHTDDGRSFTMMDAFEMDQASLYMQYARRVSGDVALTNYGIMGDAGVATLRKALEFGEPGKRLDPAGPEMKAFYQVMAEFYGRPVGEGGNKYLGNLRMLTAASRLGGMAFTQFAEMANAVSLLGVKGAFKHVGRLPGLMRDVIRGKSSPILDSIEQIGGPLGQDHRVIFPYQEPNDIRVYGRDSFNAFDRIVRAGSNALPWLSGWHYVHAAQVRGMSEQIVHKAMRYINNGEESAALKSMGMNADLAARLRNDLPNIAEFDAKGNLVALDLTKASDPAAVADFVQAVHRGGKQIIQGTYIGETGSWAHNDLLRLLVQFRSFSITAMEKQWTRQRVDEGSAKAFGILMGQMGFALPIHMARVQINSAMREDRDEYVEKQMHPAMLARAVLNYTSISGLSGDVLDAVASATGYEGSGVRGNTGSVLGNVPALGYLESTGRVFKDRDAREAIRMLPGGNLPYLTPIVNAAAAD